MNDRAAVKIHRNRYEFLDATVNLPGVREPVSVRVFGGAVACVMPPSLSQEQAREAVRQVAEALDKDAGDRIKRGEVSTPCQLTTGPNLL